MKRRRPKFRRGTKVYYKSGHPEDNGKTTGIVVNFPNPTYTKNRDISKNVWAVWSSIGEIRHGFMPNDTVFGWDEDE